ncbi:MAG: tRNA pseudouridine(38-40) synthase TruA [Bacteroidetes bacterium GWC2_33_15]|nr:MAG: tRNA pseudouridine(38-40) synthase TruA [Bacteroidetes bacterium GWA2_33_15]OFX51452.1 MAG: tRNA pseudouridine(38-40) synthase TruA [Bacteroidetes bacterium GWC2_33_15]OFX65802.1 MAG: tRNA pseudouridine(38-40) synthase TruA [Bacteroidetes bacterium GWB2_32_14]OFX69480.1 MAG: tRNA pseudouridine(38-40) synthase TruA [Bacteroidetes bacterium GWD2_33_33]HAN17736.1 tRNA pseudouridine(38-40) synthase TruA [Bacteroidales bacterium]
MRYFIQLSYKGTKYCGWQIQPNGNTIQEVVTKALSTILREKIDLTGAGRTDTGVHALFYIAHFDSENTELHTDTNLIFKLNGYLPKDISVHLISVVKPDANARFDAISRTYVYYIHQQKDPFLEEISWYYPHKLTIDLMNQASEILLGYNDFTSFSKLHTDVKTNNCKIFHAQWKKENYKLEFEIKADRFLRNMVRAIVGTLIDVGKNKITLDDFIEIIENKNRNDAGISVPAHGLFLTKIEYPENIFYKNLSS